jgi:glycine dehydrogenase subunit 1
VLSGGVDAPSRQVVRTYRRPLDRAVSEAACDPVSGRTPVTAPPPETSAVVLAQPNALGVVEDVRAHAEAAHAAGAQLIVKLEPTAVGLLATPGSQGADIVVGEGQPLAQGLVYGGPTFGFLACTGGQVRRLPGRIVGETVDHRGTRGYVMTLRARAGHPPRKRDVEHLHEPDAQRRGGVDLPHLARTRGRATPPSGWRTSTASSSRSTGRSSRSSPSGSTSPTRTPPWRRCTRPAT